MISENQIKDIYNDVVSLDKTRLDKLKSIALGDNSGGEQRGAHGESNQDIIEYIVTQVVKKEKVVIDILTGKKDNIRITNAAGSISIGVDWHIYVKGKFKCAIEVKSYWEAAMAKRTLFEMHGMKKQFPNIITMVVQFEDGMNHTKPPYKYIKEDNGVDHIINLSGRKRESNIPRYNGGEVSDFKDFKKLCYALSQSFSK